MVRMLETESFGDYFRRLRRSKGFKSQKLLSEESGISQATLSRIEGGTQIPQADTLKTLSSSLNVPFKELMHRAGHINTPWSESETGEITIFRPMAGETPEEKEIQTKKNAKDLWYFLKDTENITFSGTELSDNAIGWIADMVSRFILYLDIYQVDLSINDFSELERFLKLKDDITYKGSPLGPDDKVYVLETLARIFKDRK